MNSLSVKPDKCAILQETVNQIRRIREQEEGDGPVAVVEAPVESALVSSDGGPVGPSRPALLDTQVLGTFLLEALDGFLFVVNTEGKTEYVSDNVAHFLRYRPHELLGKSIYNIIHHGDHARFSLTLLPSTIGKNPQPPCSTSRIFSRKIAQSCRFDLNGIVSREPCGPCWSPFSFPPI